MKSQSIWISVLVAACLMGLAPAQSSVHHSWANNEGKVIEAEFVKLDVEFLHIRKGGKEFQLPLARLSPESQQLARRLAETPVQHEESSKELVFGFPATQDCRDHLTRLEKLIPKGLTDVALGMSKDELKVVRGKHTVADTFDGPPGETHEMHGKDVALDRNSFWNGGKEDRLAQIAMWSDHTRITRGQCHILGTSLLGIYGKPTYVFELKAGRDIGFRWMKDGKSVILMLLADPDTWPIAQLFVDGPDRLAVDGIPLYPLAENGKIPLPNDLAAWFNKFLDRAYPQN